MSKPGAFFICLMGVDGSGKTTQALMLVEKLHSLGISANYVWSRGDPWITRPLVNVGRRLLRKGRASSEGRPDSYEDYLSAKDSLFCNPVVRWLWAQCSFLEHHVQIRQRVYPLFTSSEVVVADRYIVDTVIDVAAGAYQVKTEDVTRLLRHLLVAGLRWPNIILLLDVEATAAMARKADIPGIEYLTRRQALYMEAARRIGAVMIDANQEVDKVFHDIFQVVAGRLAMADSRVSFQPAECTQ